MDIGKAIAKGHLRLCREIGETTQHIERDEMSNSTTYEVEAMRAAAENLKGVQKACDITHADPRFVMFINTCSPARVLQLLDLYDQLRAERDNAVEAQMDAHDAQMNLAQEVDALRGESERLRGQLGVGAYRDSEVARLNDQVSRLSSEVGDIAAIALRLSRAARPLSNFAFNVGKKNPQPERTEADVKAFDVVDNELHALPAIEAARDAAQQKNQNQGE